MAGKIAAFLWILLSPILVLGQVWEIQFNHITIEDGLSQSTVEAIEQDSVGYMWFGTNDGLNRYDGLNFKIYKHSPTDPHSISDNDIKVIYEDRKHTLWIGTQSRGLNRYDRNRERFIRYKSDPDEWNTISSNTVWSLLEDSNGDFWVGTAHGLNRMNRNSETFERFLSEPDNPNTLTNNQINLMHEDSEGVLWIGTENGLNRFNREDGSFTRFLYDSAVGSSGSSQIIRVIYEDPHGVLWVSTEMGLIYFFSRTNDEFQQLDPNSVSHFENTLSSVTDLVKDHHGNLWFGTGSQGIHYYDPDQDTISRYKSELTNPASLNSDFITTLFQSRDNTMWVGTFNGGVNYVEASPKKFVHYKNEPINPKSLSNNTVRALHEDRQGIIWIGTDGGGLNRFNPETEKFDHFRYDHDSNSGLSSDMILGIHETDHGIWLATYGGGVDLIDPKTGALIKNYQHSAEDSLSLSSNHVFVIHEAGDGKLWFGTNWGGVSVLDPDLGTFTRYLSDSNNPRDLETIGNNDIRTIYEDIRGDIWIGAHGEILSRYSKEDGLFHKYDINTNEHYFASIAHVAFEDSKNRLWFGTRGGGLLLLDREKDKFLAFTKVDGLPSNTIHAIEEDDAGNLWLSTNNGISRFHPERFEFKNFQIQDGLQSREFSPRTSLRSQNGEIFFGGLNGFNRFIPEQLVEDKTAKPILLTDLLLYNRSILVGEDSELKKPIYLTDELVLDYNQSVITFEYTTLDFSARKANQFAFMLEGFEEEWNYVGEQRRATYTNLSPGNYIFRVKAANNDGVWSEAGISLPLIIKPPFWMTGWFISLIILLTVLVIVLAVQFRIKSIRSRNRWLRKRIAERTEELRISNTTKDKLFSIIAHDLNNVAAGQVGLTDLLKHSINEGDIEISKEYVRYLDQSSNQFVSMLQNLLQWARTQTGRIQYSPKWFNLQKISQDVMKQEQAKAYNKEIILESNIDDEIELFGDPDMIALVLRNLVNNALKFTNKGGVVQLSANRMDEWIEISVSDNGLGMSKKTVKKLMSEGDHLTTQGTSNEKGTGLGFSLCQDFVKRNGGELFVESTIGEGTRISFRIKGRVIAKEVALV